ncbi:MAG: heavy metal translocating P-type ATPase [Lachnospiraceae bacterium]|nr:heavy metal translocating P-type ATPase [Lachnospiraceae bacterium]
MLHCVFQEKSMRFSIVHELKPLNNISPGRIRMRGTGPLGLDGAAAIQEALASFPGITQIKVNPRLGSVLFFYGDEHARALVLAFFARLENDARILPTAEDLAALRKSSPVNAFMPLLSYLFVRPLLPPWLRAGLAVYGALPYLWQGLRALMRRKLTVEVLDAAGIAASLAMKDFSTISMLTLLLGFGETLETWTRRKSLASLAESLALNVANVWVLIDGKEHLVPLAQVHEGDLVVVLAGNAIPVDGVVHEGQGMVNQSSMTGESAGVARTVGCSVYAGTVLETGRLVISARHVGDETRLTQVLSFIEESESLKAGIQGKFERMADLAVPFTFLLSGLVLLITRNFVRAASVLLVDYTCALKLSTPLAVLCAMHEAAGLGVVIKGGRFLEALHEVDTLVLDKTGTLTQAIPKVVEVIPAPGFARDEVLRTMACLEEHFPHPVARAVVRRAEEENLHHEEEHAHVQYVVAHGVASELNGQKLCVGSRHFVEQDEGVDLSPLVEAIGYHTALGRSLLFMGQNKRLAGLVAIEDPVRPEAADVIQKMRELGFRRIVMLTGDDDRTARALAAKVGIGEFMAEALPQDKAQVVQELTAKGAKVLMVGDGISDAPALSAAHVGVSMCDGTDLAREVANVQLSRPTLEGLVQARILSQRTIRRIHRNFVTTMVANTAFLLGGLLMILGPGTSALLHNLTTLAVSLNAMRPHFPGKQDDA